MEYFIWNLLKLIQQITQFADYIFWILQEILKNILQIEITKTI